jgi:hypothetical protein
MPDFYKEVENFVKESFTKKGEQSQIPHFENTVFWIKELNPKADEALLISAIAHDIERAFKSEEDKEKQKGLKLTDLGYLRPHEEKGAEIISEFLKKQGADKSLIEKVKHLVSRHEEGGDHDQNLLKDADSLSFFEKNVAIFIKKAKEKERTKQKFDWMFSRISSEKAKKIAKPLYEKAITELNKI